MSIKLRGRFKMLSEIIFYSVLLGYVRGDCFGLNSADPSVCSGHGICYGIDLCNCDYGYADQSCNVTYCNNIRSDYQTVCSSHGSCVAYETCLCTDGYSGMYCNVPLCYGISALNKSVCSGNGWCYDRDQCFCVEKANGTICSDFACYGIKNNNQTVCSGNGNCVHPDECMCLAGWSGSNCEIPVCQSQCRNGGLCIRPNTCNCTEHYYGDVCDVSECFGILSNTTLVCSANGVCEGYNKCKCDSGWVGGKCDVAVCYGVLSTDSSVCATNGDCNTPNNCSCNVGWSGIICSEAVCYGKTDPEACNSANGVCTKPNVCNCTDDFIGSECTIPKCFGHPAYNASVCSGNGNCTASDVCVCEDGWSGINCEKAICYGKIDPIACNGANGGCSHPNTCLCASGWGDFECNTKTCFGILAPSSGVCNGRGICVEPDICLCNSNYTGIACERWFCQGIPSTSISVCSGHGQCVDHDSCLCNVGYTGASCEEPVCFGVRRSNPNVCSGRGTCMAPDICNCVLSSGPQCNIVYCDGVASDDINVCNKRGNCTDRDNCMCLTGYTDPYCKNAICFGVLETSKDVCNGNGKCEAADYCNCTSLWSGTQCSVPVCNGTSAGVSGVCNGNGICTQPNTCNCDSGWTGVFCNKQIRDPPIECIVDKNIDPNDVDYEHIYFSSLSRAVVGCRAQPIVRIRMVTQVTFDKGIVFVRNNNNQTDLIIEPFGTGIPIVVGSEHTFTDTFERIFITGISFYTNDFTNIIPPLPLPVASLSVFKGTVKTLTITGFTIRSFYATTASPIGGNKPESMSLIYLGYQRKVEITNGYLYGSLSTAVSLSSTLSGVPTAQAEVRIENVVGTGHSGSFVFLGGTQAVILDSLTCVNYCGRITSVSNGAIVKVNYKPNVSSVFITSIVRRVNVTVNDMSVQTFNGGNLAGFYLEGTGESTVSTLKTNVFIFTNNYASGYPIGLRISGIEDSIIALTYPINHPISEYDEREKLRELAKLNAYTNIQFGDLQGLFHDVVRGIESDDVYLSSDRFCDDFCPSAVRCCDVNYGFNITTPGYGVLRFSSVFEATRNRPFGCNITSSVTRCIRISRSSTLNTLEVQTHSEDIIFDTTENLIIVGDSNKASLKKTTLIGNHILTGGLNYKIEIRDLQLLPANTFKPIFSDLPIPAETLYDLTFEDVAFRPNSITVGGGVGAIKLTNYGSGSVSITRSFFHTNLVRDLGGSVIHISARSAFTCMKVSVSDSYVYNPLDNAMIVGNVSSVYISGNTIKNCGVGISLPTDSPIPSCIYINMCPINVPPVVKNNVIETASRIDLSDLFISTMSGGGVKYTNLWLDMDTLIVSGSNSLELSNITDNSHLGGVVVRERVNGVRYGFSTLEESTERTAIRSLNMKNKGDSLFQDTVFNIDDKTIFNSPSTTLTYYCTDACPDIDISKIRFIITISALLTLSILAVIFFIVLICRFAQPTTQVYADTDVYRYDRFSFRLKRD